MQLYNKYIITTTLKLFLFLLLLMVFIMWSVRLLRYMYLVTNGGSTLFNVLKISVYALAPIILNILPITIFLAVIFSYSRLMTTGEIVILKNCGLTKLQLTIPIIILSSCITIIAYFLTIYGVHTSYFKISKIKEEISNDLSLSIIKEENFVNFQSIIMYADAKKDNLLKNIVIYDSNQEILFQSQKAVVVGENIKLYNGTFQELRNDGKIPDILFFDEYIVNINELTNQDNVVENYRIYSIPTTTLLKLFVTFIKYGENYIDELRRANLNITKKAAISEISYRFLYPLSCLILSIFSAVLMLKGAFNRTNNFKIILKTTVSSFIGYILLLSSFKKIYYNITFLYLICFLLLAMFLLSVFLIKE